MNKREWIINEIGFLPVEDEKGIDFYYKGMHDFGLGVYDTDDYAWLNTLLQYDIGGKAAKLIINHYYNEDTTVSESIGLESKDELKEVANKLGIEIDFTGWVTREPVAYEYGFEEKGVLRK